MSVKINEWTITNAKCGRKRAMHYISFLRKHTKHVKRYLVSRPRFKIETSQILRNVNYYFSASGTDHIKYAQSLCT